MRRVIALVLVQGLAASAAVLPSLHVHEYDDHDHPAHHHAPAAHEHEHHGTAALEHPTPIVESCDPGQHAVAIALGCVQVRSFHVDLAEVVGPTLGAPPITVRHVAALTDIRVHGPPVCAQVPSRAPPLTHLA